MSIRRAIPDQPVSCARLRAGEPFIGKQGFSYAPAISAETVGASAIHMQFLTIPPGARAKAHKHEAHETAIYVLSGEVGMYYGERLEHHMVARPGDFVYIPANVPHLPYNMSQTEPATPSLRAPTPTSRKASSSCRISTRSAHEDGPLAGGERRRLDAPGPQLATYARHNVLFEKEWLSSELGIGLTPEKIVEIGGLDNPANMDELAKLVRGPPRDR